MPSTTTFLSAATIYWDLQSEMPLFPYRSMRVVERAELWRPANKHNPARFVETVIIWRADSEFFLQYSPSKYSTSSEVYFTDGDIHRIDGAHVWPTYYDGYEISDTVENRYVEYPTCIEWDFREGPYVMYPRDAYKRQAELVRSLITRPHRNVAEFFGCRVDWYWMDGLVFQKYERCLAELGPDEIEALNANQVIEGIQRGIKHLHNLDIMHQAIYPKNIRFDAQGRPVIVNFRNADWEGQALSFESIELIELAYDLWSHRGSNSMTLPYTPGEYFKWIEEDHPKTHPDIDYFGLTIIRDFFREPSRYASLNESGRKIYYDCRKHGHIGSKCCELEGRDFDPEDEYGDEEKEETVEKNGDNCGAVGGFEEDEERDEEDEEEESKEVNDRMKTLCLDFIGAHY